MAPLFYRKKWISDWQVTRQILQMVNGKYLTLTILKVRGVKSRHSWSAQLPKWMANYYWMHCLLSTMELYWLVLRLAAKYVILESTCTLCNVINTNYVWLRYENEDPAWLCLIGFVFYLIPYRLCVGPCCFLLHQTRAKVTLPIAGCTCAIYMTGYFLGSFLGLVSHFWNI